MFCFYSGVPQNPPSGDQIPTVPSLPNFSSSSFQPSFSSAPPHALLPIARSRTTLSPLHDDHNRANMVLRKHDCFSTCTSSVIGNSAGSNGGRETKEVGHDGLVTVPFPDRHLCEPVQLTVVLLEVGLQKDASLQLHHKFKSIL